MADDPQIDIPDDDTVVCCGSTCTTGRVMHRLANAAFCSGFPITDPVVMNWDDLQARDRATRADAIASMSAGMARIRTVGPTTQR